MKLKKIVDWLDGFLKVADFDDVSNNGLQIARTGEDVKLVAFAVDASLKSVRAAAAAGAQLLVVHHGISWGGGVKRLTGGVYGVVKAAMEADLAVYASHLPLDANRTCGNNWELARFLGLTNVKPAFNYHGNVIGVVGTYAGGLPSLRKKLGPSAVDLDLPTRPLRIGICSGGAGSFAPDAKALGCDLYVTGEADWGEKIAAENVGMPMVCGGHYETETFGVKGLAREMKKRLKVPAKFIGALLAALAVSGGAFGAESSSRGEDAPATVAADAPATVAVDAPATADAPATVAVDAADFEDEAYEFDRFYVGAAGALVLPQGGGNMRRLGGAALRFGYYLTESWAIEGEAAWMEDACGLAARALWHWWGYERLDPFFLMGAKGWINGDVGPDVGIGAFYHLTESLSLRADAEATLGLDTGVKMEYSLSLGLQYSF